MNPLEIFKLIKSRILSIQEFKKKPIRIAINGIEGVGKTTMAKKLTKFLNSENIKTIQVSIDGFHFNKEIRYKLGRNSANGYYENAYDENSFLEKVLLSSQSDNPTYIMATHDLETDKYLKIKPIEIKNKTVIITDGAYLFKPEYRNHWDLKIYLKTSFEIAMYRGIDRDKDLLGGFNLTKEKFKKRYHKSSKIYISKNDPEQIAEIVIDNSDFNSPRIIKNIFYN